MVLEHPDRVLSRPPLAGRCLPLPAVYDIKGTRSIYVGEPLLPRPAMARWIESRVREAAGAATAAR